MRSLRSGEPSRKIFALLVVQYTKHLPTTNQQCIPGLLPQIHEVFLDDFNVYSNKATHIHKLCPCFEKCREYGNGLNQDKSAFLVHSGVVLGYVVCLHGKLLDPRKITAIVEMPAPETQREVQRLFGVAQFNQCFIQDFAPGPTPSASC